MSAPFPPVPLAMSGATIIDGLVGQAGTNPDCAAIISADGIFSWNELHSTARRIAVWLLSQDWFNVGARTLICLPNRYEFVPAYYGIIMAGGIVTTVSPRIKSGELAYICDQIDPVLIICESSILNVLQGAAIPPIQVVVVDNEFESGSKRRFWNSILAVDVTGFQPRVESDATAVIAFSSGTTGRPKGCMLSLRALSAQVEAWSAWNGLNRQSRSLISLPLFHIAGMQTGMNASIFVGSAMMLSSQWSVSEFARQVSAHNPSHWVGTTTMVVDLVRSEEAREIDFSSFRMMGGGGAPMPQALADEFRQLTACEYLDGYGLTETCGAVLLNPIGDAVLGSVGAPIFNCRVLVADLETGIALGAGEIGEIVVQGPTLFDGYWLHDSASEEAFRQVPGVGRVFRTGDIGRSDESGRIFLVDRLKRLIIVSGQKVSPNEVEGVLQSHPEISECCVVSCPDSRRGEAVKAFIVTREASAAPSLEELQAWCQTELSSYKWPRSLKIVESLPRSESGKVDWKSLQDAEWAA